jgi:ketosteroid isomerase-like protein
MFTTDSLAAAARRALALVLLMAAARPLAAQLPGESYTTSQSSMRQQFLALTYEEVKATLNDWQESIRKQDLNGLKKMVADEVLLSAADGWTVKGKAEFAHVGAARMAKVAGYNMTAEDFDASGEVAYVMGRMRYDLQETNRLTTVTGDFTIVFFRRGPRWQIRSYVERADLKE